MSNALDEVDQWQRTVEELYEQKGRMEDELREILADKKEVVLGAHTGNLGEQDDLNVLNKNADAAIRALDDLAEAINQAERHLHIARRNLDVEREVRRLMTVSDLCEELIEADAKVDTGARELRNAIEQCDAITREILKHVPMQDDGARRRLGGSKRMQVAVERELGDFFPEWKTGDPRKGRALADMDREALAPLAVTPQGARALAVAKYPLE